MTTFPTLSQLRKQPSSMYSISIPIFFAGNKCQVISIKLRAHLIPNRCRCHKKGNYCGPGCEFNRCTCMDIALQQPATSSSNSDSKDSSIAHATVQAVMNRRCGLHWSNSSYNGRTNIWQSRYSVTNYTCRKDTLYLFLTYHEHTMTKMLNFVIGTLAFYTAHKYETFS